MTAEEKLELLLELLALADGPDVQNTERKSEVEGGAEPEEEVKVGFGNSSG